MKRYLPYIILAALVLLAYGCKKETDADRKDLDSRERVPIAVSYSDAGTAVTSLTFPHGAVQKEITVELNNENLHWNIESDKDWCRIIPDTHIGPGSFFIEIDANEGFDAREDATLTFVAGEYRGSTLRVSQSGSAFIISHPYLLSPKGELDYEVEVTTIKDAQWEIEYNEWINVEEINGVSDESTTTKTLKIWAANDDDASRYGIITLTDAASGDKDEIALYQFGKDFQYDSEDRIFFPNDEPAEISFIAPPYVVKTINAPAYATTTMTSNDDGTVTISIAFADNLSDCEMLREIPVSITLNNTAAASINLPAMVQDFLPAGGLMTAAGLKAFAAKVAAGESTESWETDGVVKVLQDIDMDGVTDWAGIGTEDKPFAGTFDGGNYSIINLRNATAPLFNFSDGATIKNITIAKSCSFAFDGVSGGALALAASSTAFDRCAFNGTLEYSGTPDESTVGGLVGEADAMTTFNLCKFGGTLSLTSGANESAVCLAGGIAGLSKGELTNCEVSGKIKCMSGLPTIDLGGITSVLDEGTVVNGNSFTGEITIDGSSLNLAIGGLYGHIRSGSWTFDKTTDMSSTSGTISILNFAASLDVSKVYAGGFIGLIGEGVGLTAKGYSLMTNFVVDKLTNVHTGLYLNCGGFLGSCEPDLTAGEMLFENLENHGTFDIKFVNTVKNLVRRSCTGGIVGLVRGPATFKYCINKAELGKNEANCNNSSPNPRGNERTQILGGIAGHAYGGNMTFSHCTNDGKLCNGHYNNNGAWYSTDPNNFVYGNFMAATCTGGILGAFNYKQEPENKTLTIEDCACTANIWAIRGYVGGIVGFAQKATITNCSWKGVCDGANTNQASFKGGIAGGLAESSVSGCSVNANLVSHKGGSAQAADSGGIVARVIVGAPVTISNCSFYGDLSCSATGANNFAGGIVSTVEENTVIKNCRFGGKVLGATVTENTVTAKAVGNGTCSVEDISLWNGI